MTSNPKTLFRSLLAAAAATGMLFAQAAPRSTHPAAPNQAVRVQREVSRLRAWLNLSRDQQQQAARIYSNAAMANAQVRASLRAAQASLASATKANNTLAITQASSTIGRLRSQLATNQAQAQAAIVKILMPEQQTRYRQLASRTRNRSHLVTDGSRPRTSPTPPALPQGSYIITDLGVLESQKDTDSEALAINNSGIVVGISGVFDIEEDGYDNQDAFIWTPSPTDSTTGTMSYLSGLPGSTCIVQPYFDTFFGVWEPSGPSKTDTVASSINSSGQVAGYSWAAADGICNDGTDHGFIYSSSTGSYQDLGLPPGYTLLPPYDTHIRVPNVFSEATAINDAGQVVGWAADYTTGAGGAWLYDGSYHILGGFPVELGIYPQGINSQETTVGWTGYFGFAHTGTGPFLPSDQLGTLGGAFSAANGINSSGMIVGNADTASGSSHAFLLQSGSMKDLGGLSADIWDSNASGINNSAHDVVGDAELDENAPDYFAETSHAVIWPSGGPAADLNLLLDPSLVISESCPTCWELVSANAINDRGQIVGTGAYQDHYHAFLLTPKCINDGGDTDGDGLCDDWEKYGYTDPKTGQVVNLPAMGAGPMHKDIFVQADYMVDSSPGTCGYMVGCTFGHTHKPNPAAMALLIAAFANAPVENPDGTTGIDLHVDCGSDCIMNPLTGETWGDTLSKAQAIDPEIPVLGGPMGGCVPGSDQGCPYDWTAFNNIMMANFPPERAAIFHYMIFAHSLGIYNDQGNLTNTSGSSQMTPSDSFVVALAYYPGLVGTSSQQAGTFMHELGHNLGLHHGGMDNVNFKPNYLSAMNYLFQMSGLYVGGIGGTIDYSRFSFIPQLNENALNDAVGLQGGPLIANYGTAYYCPNGNPSNDPLLNIGERFVLNANGPIDWKCDGNPMETDVQADINAQYTYLNDKPIAVYQSLNSSEDWSHLIYAGGGIGAAGVGAGSLTGASDFEYGVPVTASAPYQVQMVSPGFAKVLPGGSLNLTFTITNTGLQQDTYQLTPVTQYAWWNTSSVPGSVTLAGGARQTITIPVTVPASFGCGSPTRIRATFTLQAVSQTHASVTDSGVAELDVPPSPAVPSVTGLTQAAAQAAILSAGLAVGTVTVQSSATVPAGTVISQSPAACGVATAGSPVSLTVSSGTPPMDTVPSIVGLTQADAGVLLSAAGLAVGTITSAMSSTVPQFKVISQDPAAGAMAPPDSLVNFVISSGSVQSYQVPDLTGLTQTQATAALTGVGLTIGTATPVLSPTAFAFSVVSQSPAAGSPVSLGAPVNVQFSAGSHLIQVPSVVGEVQDYALQAIAGAEFEVAVSRQTSMTVPDGYVVSQDPAGSASALLSSPVNLVVSSGGPVMAAVPNVNVTLGGIQYLDETTLFQAGFAIGSVTTQPSPSALVSNRAALSQNPAPGALAAWDTSVSMVKAWGQLVNVTVPNVVGMTLQAATAAISSAPLPIAMQGDSWTYSFTTQSSATVPAGVVISQNPPAGPATIEADPGQFNTVLAPVALVVSSGPLVVPSYSYLSQFGEAGNQQGQFEAVIGLAIDQVSRNIVVGDSHGRVQIFDANGGFRSYFGGQGATTAGPGANWANRFPGDGTGDGLFVGRADAIAIDPVNHNIVIVDELGNRVMIFNSAGQFQSVFGSRGTGPGQLSFDYIYPTGVAIDPTSENIVVADNGNSRVQIFNSAGVYLSQFGTLLNQNSQFSGEPSGVAIDPVSHNIVVADLLDACLQIFNSDGVYLSRFGTYGSGNGQFDEPLAVAIDPVSRNIVVTDRGAVNAASAYGINQRVQIFDSTGVFLSQFGGAGGGNGQFGAVGYAGPGGIAIDPVSHNILVTDNSPDNLVQSRVEIFALPAGPTTTTVVTSLNPATVGQSVTFTATVTGSSPTGTIQFMDGASSLGAPVALTGNSATLSLSTLSAGTHSITAVYSGDSSNPAGTSAVLSEVVNLTAMTPTIASSLNPATAGQSVTFTSTVPGNNPTGTVQFMDGNIGLGAPVALTGGAASLPFSKLSVGTHAIAAVYSGDSSHAAGASPILNEVVSAAVTAPVVTAPAPVTIPATQAAGATSGASPALAAFLAGATAVESISPPPLPMPRQIRGVPVTNSTLFPVGTTTVTFVFKDSNGNTGMATSTVTIVTGTPTITGSTAGVGMDPSGAIYVDVVLTNTGTGTARNLNISSLTLGTLSGTGTAAYNTQLSPALPMLVTNNLDVGNKVAVRLYFNVPSTATQISITESGPVQDVLGNNSNYSTMENASTGPGNRCDVNRDGVVDLLDARAMVNQGLGAIPADNRLNQGELVSVVDIQIDINAALHLGCSAQ